MITRDRFDDERWPALDGLRAIAVTAVILFHLDLLPGGNLGVDAFFVLSGWLITTRLLAQAQRDGGRVDLRAFWSARARRLLPASLLLIVTVVVVWTALQIIVPSLRHDALWALGWASNWGTITSGSDYWARFGEPAPLTHLWSLAVEEQFYLVWPLLLAVLVPRTRRAPDVVLVASTVLAVASIAWMIRIYDPGSPTATYVNTFARAHSLLIGAALAGLTASADRRRRVSDVARLAVRPAVVVLLVIVAAASADAAWLYSWGFALFALAMGIVVVAAVDGAGARVLASPPLRWVGDRSFGIYLWHWPAILVLSHARAPVSGPWLDALRVGAALAVAAASYAWLEMPVRHRRSPTRAMSIAAVGAFAASLAVIVSVDLPSPPAPSEPSTVALAPVAATPALASATDPSLSSLPTEVVLVSHRTHEGPLRVLVAGDSTAVHLAGALLPFAAAHPELIVAGTAAFPGCGLTAADDGRRHEQTNPDGSTSLIDLSGCAYQWTTIPDRVPTEQIDVVLVDISTWDGADIQLANGRVVSIADPVGRALVTTAYRRFVNDVEHAGAEVVWVTPPDVHLQWGAIDTSLNEPKRWAAMRSVIDELGVEQIDLASWLAAKGLEGPDARPDGVHLAADVNRAFVEDIVVPGLTHLFR